MAIGKNRFAPEEDIAIELGVSRATVRKSMQRLQEEGYLSSRRGKGNFGHPSVSRLRQRLYTSSDFMKLLDNGIDPVVCSCLFWNEAPPSNKMSRRCTTRCNRVFRQFWQYSVGGEPQIFCMIETPVELFVKTPQPPVTFNLISWLNDYCGRDVAYFATHFCCDTDINATQGLGLHSDTYLQNWQEVVFDITDREVSFSDIYFHPQNVDFSMVLKY